jgi:hypothetical protein
MKASNGNGKTKKYQKAFKIRVSNSRYGRAMTYHEKNAWHEWIHKCIDREPFGRKLTLEDV